MSDTKYIVIRHIIKKERNGFSAYCPELDVCSQGKTVEAASKNLTEAALLYLNTLEDLGTREQIFKERKILMYNKKEKPKVPVDLIPNKHSFVTSQTVPCC